MELRKCYQWKVVGGLSEPSKMPGYSYSIPPKYCRVGGRLSKKKGTICSKCQSKKGNYRRNCVKNCLERRFESLTNPEWVPCMTYLIGRQPIPHFRWHDAGDVQGQKHLANIMKIAEDLPKNFFWLPTQERDMIRKYRAKQPEPDNVTIRFSGIVVNKAPRMNDKDCYSMVYNDLNAVPKGAYICPSNNQGHKCMKCRACWNRKVKLVAYKESK